uniref:Aha1_N domain-containing protein n=1 Tax=Rhabditophanes sp. KR3021 TaxID=114890 RepID=A0AC35TRF8_9BILA
MKVCEDNTEIDATTGDYIELDVVGWQDKLGLQLEDDHRNADLCIKVLGTEREIFVLRVEMVVDTIAENNRKIVCLRSLVKFVNHINIPYEVYSQGNNGSLNLCSNKEPMIVPISKLYTRTREFLFKPIGDEYEMSEETISWYNFEKDNRAWIK